MLLTRFILSGKGGKELTLSDEPSLTELFDEMSEITEMVLDLEEKEKRRMST